MNIWAWIGLSGTIILTLLPFLKEEHRSKEEIRKAALIITIVLGIIIAVLVFHVNYLIAFGIGFILLLLTERKFYSRGGVHVAG
jgi:D-alanyl-D-alanine carboxypeptidase